MNSLASLPGRVTISFSLADDQKLLAKRQPRSVSAFCPMAANPDRSAESKFRVQTKTVSVDFASPQERQKGFAELEKFAEDLDVAILSMIMSRV